MKKTPLVLNPFVSGGGNMPFRIKDGDAPAGGGKTVLTSEALQKMITDSTKAAVDSLASKLPQGITLSPENLKSISDAVAATLSLQAGAAGGTKGNEGKAVEFTVDNKALGESIKGAMEAAFASIKLPSRMEHQGKGNDDPHDISLPISHRSGNLSVGAKQLLNVACRKSMNDGVADDLLLRANKNGAKALEVIRRQAQLGLSVKAIITSTTPGSNLIDVDLSSDIMQRLYLSSDLAAALMASELVMPTNPYKIPLSTTRPVFTIGGENSGPGADTAPGTGQVTLETKKLMAKVYYSYEQDEDQIVPILPWLQDQLARSGGEHFEGAVIGGDADGTHIDSDIQAAGADNYLKAFNGFRRAGLLNSATKLDMSTGGISIANLAALRKLMKKWGVKPRDLLILVGPQVYNDLIALADTLRIDAVGQSQARLLTGEAPSIFGIPILVSEGMREDLNASGVYDGSTTTKKSIVMLHRPSWIVGVKRDFTIETDKNIEDQRNVIVASFRRDIKPQEATSASIPNTVVGYNLP